MKTKAMITMLVSVAMILTAPLVTLGAQGGTPGPPDGSTDPPTPDYGDLIKLYRDVRGVPILTEQDGDSGLCQQPMYFDDVLCSSECKEVSVDSVDVVVVDPTTCAIVTGCEACTQEVDFGRISDARSDYSVFESQLEDVVVNLATADCITRDPAGRLVTSRVADDNVTSSAIDSPLQNLAIYRQLMLTGSLGSGLDNIVSPDNVLITAARALGAASDKTGEVNVHLVDYLNQIMGLSDQASTFLGQPICQDNREEVTGTVQLVTKCFLDYSAYGYGRTGNFGALPAPAYIPASGPQDGEFEYLYVIDPGAPTFGIEQGSITAAVFADEPGFLDGNIGGFAQAADDARAVINFMHSWAVPVDYQTPVTCEASGEIRYDVSISDVSGLQVPAQMVDGSEGREFVVTVANAGPDEASGTVTVKADAENGVHIDGSPWTFYFPDLDAESPNNTTLAAGGSRSWTQLFTINLGAKTTIQWTATVDAEFDVNPGNDNVTATTNVRVTGGGGRP